MSVEIPKTMRALVENDDAKSASIREIPVPALEDNDVLVKIEYVAQNPTDWKHVAFLAPPGSIIGCDFSGTVAKVGEHLKTPLKVGDRVAGSVHGGKFPDKGSFAEYARAESDLIWKVPENISLEKAVSYGIPWVTVLHALVHSQGHKWPPANKVDGEQWFLVYGASSSVGLFAVQFAKALGYKVAAICSPHNYDLVKSFGADEVFDYHDGLKAGEAIRKATGGGVTVGMDTISEGKSFEIALSGFKENTPGRLECILKPKDEDHKIRPDVKITMILMYTLLGKAFTFFPGADLPAIPEDRAFGAEAMVQHPKIIEKYNIKPNPLENRGGLDDILAGFQEQSSGKVSGKKLVYKIAA